MTQANLFYISQKLKSGQAIVIERDELWEASTGELPDTFDWERLSEVEKFTKKIEQNWNIKMTQNFMTGNWLMSKNK